MYRKKWPNWSVYIISLKEPLNFELQQKTRDNEQKKGTQFHMESRVLISNSSFSNIFSFFNLFWNFEGQNMKRGGNMFCIPTNQNIFLSMDFKWCFKNRGHRTCNPATSNSSGCNAFELEHGFYFEFFSQIFCLKKTRLFWTRDEGVSEQEHSRQREVCFEPHRKCLKNNKNKNIFNWND